MNINLRKKNSMRENDFTPSLVEIHPLTIALFAKVAVGHVSISVR